METRVKAMKGFSNGVDELFVILEGLFSKSGSKDGIIRIRTYKNKFSIFKRSNMRFMIEEYWKSIQPFKEHIETRDEKFFLENDLDSLGLHDHKPDIDEDTSRLKYIWNEINDEDKNKIWDIVQGLTTNARTICF